MSVRLGANLRSCVHTAWDDFAQQAVVGLFFRTSRKMARRGCEFIALTLRIPLFWTLVNSRWMKMQFWRFYLKDSFGIWAVAKGRVKIRRGQGSSSLPHRFLIVILIPQWLHQLIAPRTKQQPKISFALESVASGSISKNFWRPQR